MSMNRGARRRIRLLSCVLVGLAAASSATARVDGEDAIEALDNAGVPKETARALVGRWQAAEGGSTEGLVELVRKAGENGAPVDLVADKALEGLAKRVPPSRLLDVLERWSAQMARSGRMARELRHELEPRGITEREAALRLSILARTAGGTEMVERLRQKARERGADLPRLLRVGEAMDQLAEIGVEPEEALELGSLWLNANLQLADIGRFVRAIENGAEIMSANEVAKRVTRELQHEQDADGVLEELERELETAAVEDRGDVPFAVGRGPKNDHGSKEPEPGRKDDKQETGPPDREEEHETGPPNRDDPPGNSGSAGRGQDGNPGRGSDEHPGRGADK